MAGISRVNGNAAAGAFYGYTPAFYLIEGTNVGTASTGGGTSAITEGNFEKAIRAIRTRASIVFVGPRADGGFVVAIDQPSANPYSTANTDTDMAAALVLVVEAATGATDVTATAKTLAASQFD
jgi:hypothetical protein